MANADPDALYPEKPSPGKPYPAWLEPNPKNQYDTVAQQNASEARQRRERRRAWRAVAEMETEAIAAQNFGLIEKPWVDTIFILLATQGTDEGHGGHMNITSTAVNGEAERFVDDLTEAIDTFRADPTNAHLWRIELRSLKNSAALEAYNAALEDFGAA